MTRWYQQGIFGQSTTEGSWMIYYNLARIGTAVCVFRLREISVFIRAV